MLRRDSYWRREHGWRSALFCTLAISVAGCARGGAQWPDLEQLHPDLDVGVYLAQDIDGGTERVDSASVPLILCLIEKDTHDRDIEYWYVRTGASNEDLQKLESATDVYLRAVPSDARSLWRPTASDPFDFPSWLVENFTFSGQRVEAAVYPSDWQVTNVTTFPRVTFRAPTTAVLHPTTPTDPNASYTFPDPIIGFRVDTTPPPVSGSFNPGFPVDTRLQEVAFYVTRHSDRVAVRYELLHDDEWSATPHVNRFQRFDISAPDLPVYRVPTSYQFVLPAP